MTETPDSPQPTPEATVPSADPNVPNLPTPTQEVSEAGTALTENQTPTAAETVDSALPASPVPTDVSDNVPHDPAPIPTTSPDTQPAPSAQPESAPSPASTEVPPTEAPVEASLDAPTGAPVDSPVASSEVPPTQEAAPAPEDAGSTPAVAESNPVQASPDSSFLAALEARHPSLKAVAQWFTTDHLPEEHLHAQVAKEFQAFTLHILGMIQEDTAELTTAVRKLLEAKDAAVRSALPPKV